MLASSRVTSRISKDPRVKPREVAFSLFRAGASHSWREKLLQQRLRTPLLARRRASTRCCAQRGRALSPGA